MTMASIAEVRAMTENSKVSVFEVRAGEDTGAFRGYRYTPGHRLEKEEGSSIRRSFAGIKTVVPSPKGGLSQSPAALKSLCRIREMSGPQRLGSSTS